MRWIVLQLSLGGQRHMMNVPMRLRAAIFVALLCCCACKPPEESQAKAIIGAILIDGRGGPPLSDSTVVMAGDRILAAGPRTVVSVHPQASRIDGSGKYIVPAFVDVSAGREIPRISTLAEVEKQVSDGAMVLIGMIRDTTTLDPEFVSRMRDLRVTFAPALSTLQPGSADLAAASANTKTLFAAGVPIAVAAEGHDFVHECELLVQAGVPPLDTIVAATRNGAVALHQDSARGTIEPGKDAGVLLLSANPGDDIRNLRQTVSY